MYICHKGEDGDKDHIHLRIEPNKKLDPMDLQEQLREYKLGSDKPLGVRPFRPSKEEDWILYAVHHEQYLKIKYGGGDSHEKLPYKWQDIKVSEYYDMETAYIRAVSHLEHNSVNMAAKLQQGTSPLELILNGENVFTVNAINRAMSLNDYNRVSKQLETAMSQIEILDQELSDLKDAVEKIGFNIEYDENQKIKLIKANSTK